MRRPQPRPEERELVPSPAKNPGCAFPPSFLPVLLGFAVTRDISMACLPLCLLGTPSTASPSRWDALEKGMAVDHFPRIPSLGRATSGKFLWGWGCRAASATRELRVLLWDQRRGKRLPRGAVPPVGSALSHKTFVCTRPEGMGRCGAELLMHGCLMRKAALDLEGTIYTSIF